MPDGETLSRAAGIHWLREHIVAGTHLTQLTRYGIPLPTPCTYTVVQVKPSAGLVLDDGQGNTNYRSP